MRQRFIAWFNNPTSLVGLTAFLTALLVQSGELGTIDTTRRLQTARSFWTSAPAVAPGDIGLIGRNGHLHYWYGIGQSVLMLPADVIGRSTIGFISRFRQPPIWLGEETIVAYIVSPLVCTVAVLMCFYFLRLLGFTVNQSIAGACSLLLGTTFLHYVQIMQENNFLLLLTLAGFYFHYKWFRTGSTSSLLFGSMALGANILTRLTTGLDLLSVALFISLCLWYETDRQDAMLGRLVEYGRTCIPCYIGFIVLDRLYHYYRFGSLFDTYLRIFGEQFAWKYPVTSVSGFPWSTPFWTGFLGPLITPQKSIFLFDSLIVLTFLLAFRLWKWLPSDTKAYVISLVGLLLSYIVFYAKYYDWSGDVAWGDRFVTTPVQMLAMISIPLLMRYRRTLQPWIWKSGKIIAATSVVIQLSSVFFWYPLEKTQMTILGNHVFVIGLRFLNIIAFAFGTMERWGLSNQLIRSGFMNSPYFFPFLVMRRGTACGWKLAVLFAGWIYLLIAVIMLLFMIRGKIRSSEEFA